VKLILYPAIRSIYRPTFLVEDGDTTRDFNMHKCLHL